MSFCLILVLFFYKIYSKCSKPPPLKCKFPKEDQIFTRILQQEILDKEVITIIITEDSIKKNQKYYKDLRKAFTVFVVSSIGIIGSVITGIALGILKTKKKNKKNKQ